MATGLNMMEKAIAEAEEENARNAIATTARKIRGIKRREIRAEFRRCRQIAKTCQEVRHARERQLSLARKHGFQFALRALTHDAQYGHFSIIRGGQLQYRAVELRKSNLTTSAGRRRALWQEWKALRTTGLAEIERGLQWATAEGMKLVPVSNPCLQWEIPDLELNEVPIGTMKIETSLAPFCVLVENDSENSRNGYPHPHVGGDGDICWNGFDSDARAYANAGDFLAMRDVIDNLLKTYNPESPYIKLGAWSGEDGEECGGCGEYASEHSSSYSEVDNCTYCYECGCYCERCEETVYHERYCVELSACDSCVENDACRCDYCDHMVWNDYITYFESEGCYACDVCFNEHYGTCEKCQESFDNSNLTEIEDSGKHYCGNCLSEVSSDCEDCGETFFRDNLTKEEETGGLYCETCFPEQKEGDEEDEHDGADSPGEERERTKLSLISAAFGEGRYLGDGIKRRLDLISGEIRYSWAPVTVNSPALQKIGSNADLA